MQRCTTLNCRHYDTVATDNGQQMAGESYNQTLKIVPNSRVVPVFHRFHCAAVVTESFPDPLHPRTTACQHADRTQNNGICEITSNNGIHQPKFSASECEAAQEHPLNRVDVSGLKSPDQT